MKTPRSFASRQALSTCLSAAGHDWVGQDLGVAMGGAANGVVVSDDPVALFAKAQAVIDFTAPAASVGFAALAAQARAVHVIGTTGLQPEDLEKFNAAARHAVIVRAGNMSLGVNLRLGLPRRVPLRWTVISTSKWSRRTTATKSTRPRAPR